MSSPLDHGTVSFQVDSPGVAPGSPVCGASVFLLDHEPDSLSAEAVGLEPTSGCQPPPVFKTGSSSSRMTSVDLKLRGLESNQRPPGSEPGVTTSSNYPGQCCPSRHARRCKGSGRRIRTFIAWFKARQPTVSRSPITLSECPVGVEPALSSLEGWHLCRSAKGTIIKAEGEGVEPSRLIARPFSRQLPSPIGLPFRIKLRRQESNLRQGG